MDNKAEYVVSIFAEPSSIKDMIKGTEMAYRARLIKLIPHPGVLHTIFFHRTFPAVRPIDRDILDVTLPAVDDVDIESLIDQQSSALVRQMDNGTYSPYTGHGNGRGQLAVQFYEKRQKPRISSYFFGKAEEDVCWEQWTIDVTLARPRTEAEYEKVREAMEASLQKAVMKILVAAGEEKEHIPQITTNETHPFPYKILVNPKEQGRGRGLGVF